MKDWRAHIESTPEVLYGKPVIKNTRVPVDILLEKLSQGESMEDLLKAYPRLTKEDILAALAYAAEIIKRETVHPLPS